MNTTTSSYAGLQFECRYTVERLDADEAGGPGVVYEIQEIRFDGTAISSWDKPPLYTALSNEDGGYIRYPQLLKAAETAAQAHHDSRSRDAEAMRQTPNTD